MAESNDPKDKKKNLKSIMSRDPEVERVDSDFVQKVPPYIVSQLKEHFSGFVLVGYDEQGQCCVASFTPTELHIHAFADLVQEIPWGPFPHNNDDTDEEGDIYADRD